MAAVAAAPHVGGRRAKRGTYRSAPPIRTVTDAEVARHFPLVHYVLNRMTRKGQIVVGVDLDDLEQVGRLAVWEALRRWRPGKGAQSTYLASYIWGYVLKHQRDVTKATGWHRDLGQVATVASLDAPVSADSEVTLGDVLAQAPDELPFDEEIEGDALLRDIEARVERELPWQRQIVAYGILAGQSQGVAADLLGVSRSRVSQLVPRVREDLERFYREATR